MNRYDENRDQVLYGGYNPSDLSSLLKNLQGVNTSLGLLGNQIQDILKQIGTLNAPTPAAPTTPAIPAQIPKIPANIPSAQTPGIRQTMGVLGNMQPGQNWRQKVANILGLLNMKSLP
jgi:hypothetical protein